MVSASVDGIVIIWDLESVETKNILKGHTGSVNSILITKDDSTIVSAGDDMTIKIWDLKSGENVSSLDGHEG